MSMLNFLKLHPDAKLPTYGTAGAACFDLYSVEDFLIRAGTTVALNTGVAVEIPHGNALMIYSRSGHGFKHGVCLANCTGVIDSDYRGSILVALTCRQEGPGLRVRVGDRIAQGMIVSAPQWPMQFVESLSDTVRGAQGFGSTGN